MVLMTNFVEGSNHWSQMPIVLFGFFILFIYLLIGKNRITKKPHQINRGHYCIVWYLIVLSNRS